jgi:hypothetical protein
LIPFCASGMWHIVGKLLTRATTLFRTTFQLEVWSQSYGTPKSQESQLGQFWDSHLRDPRQSHLDVAPTKSHIIYYKGEGGGFPQVRAMVSVVCPCCSWLILAPKMLQRCTNHFVLVLCRPVWVGEACQFFLVPSRSLSTPFYPSKVLRAKEHAPTFYSFVIFYLRLTFESSKELRVRKAWKVVNMCLHITPRYVLIHYRFHYILNEFGHFYHVKTCQTLNGWGLFTTNSEFVH